ncbi:probable cytochrome P450 6a13 [Leguminivora glycinivorella]|uniref:probable cytochrome P450 6a13 n=1 Tax=Leguminivora glycinivorella TaxID=1035111 RepID=UPI00200F91E1|nr:probable cytochrome P450 6a13 [Leguminivora glycinivorella]
MAAVGDEMAKYVARKCDGGAKALDVKDISTKFTADILGNAICGVVNNSFEDPDSLFVRITREVCFATTVKDNLKDALQTAWPRLSWLFQMRFSSPTSEEQLLYLTRKMIEERTATGDKRNDLYQVAVSMRENDPEKVFTDHYISSLVYTIMLDQYETGSNAVVNTLFALAWHPEVQDRLRKEIFDFKSQAKGEYSLEDIENLKYLEKVLSETLRMCCPVPVISRECTNDCIITLPTGKPLKISKGTQVIVPNQAIHMDSTYYPDPEKFDPERFTEEEIAKRPKYTYLPFGEGPKRCLAPRLGALQVKVAIISLLDRFKIRPAGKRFPLACEPGVFLISTPVSGTELHFEPIDLGKS